MRTASTHLALALLALALACATPARPPAPPAIQETGLLPFWQVTGTPAPLYLLGSIHLGPEEVTLDPAIVDAFRAADALVVELDLSDATPERTFELLRRYGVPSDGRTLDEVLERRTLQELDAFLEERGATLGNFRFMKPWVVMTVVTTMIWAEAGLSASGGIDAILTERAAQMGKDIVALETLEFQFSLFDQLDLGVQDRMLREILEEPEAVANSLELIDAWNAGDLAAVEAYTLTPSDADPELLAFQEAVYFARNREMAQRVEALAGEGRPLLVVVGVGHMVGDQGIPALLAERGLGVQRIEKSPPPTAEIPSSEER